MVDIVAVEESGADIVLLQARKGDSEAPAGVFVQPVAVQVECVKAKRPTWRPSVAPTPNIRFREERSSCPVPKGSEERLVFPLRRGTRM